MRSSHNRLSLALAAALALAALPATAQDDVVEQRQDLMEKNGDAAKLLSGMVRGQRDFDAEAAAKAARMIATDTEAFVDLFPEGSEGGDTDASEAVWDQRPAFEAEAAKMVIAANEAADAAANGPDAFRAAFQAVGQSCSSCHQTFRQD